MSIPILDRKYWRCSCNFEMSMAVITPYGSSNTLKVYGDLRTRKDLGEIIWECKDSWSHPDMAYPTRNDFTGVTWSFHIKLEGPLKKLDEAYGSTLTVYYIDGSYQYVRLWNYVGTGATNTEADITLPFDNLYAGWEADQKINPKYISKLTISFAHSYYDGGATTTPLDDSCPFVVTFSNWSVGTSTIGDEPSAWEAHSYRLADGYDDNTDITPERFIEHFWALGFRGPINLYIGASHYYDKKAVSPLELWDFTEYRYELITTAGKELCSAAEAWLADLFTRAQAKGFGYVVASVSLEMVDAPLDWVQKAYDGEWARTNWTPRPFVIDAFCNSDAQDYYKALALKLCEMQSDAGLTPCYQLGESWWWTQEVKPCFYGDATKEAFKNHFGYYPYEFRSVFEDYSGYELTIQWMRDRNGAYAHLLRDHIRSTYPNAEFTVLFFPPSVVDPEVAGEMMGIANYPKSHWAKPNLSFFQLEDYDWLINNDLDWHYKIWNMAQDDLGYNTDEIQYFAGFVLRPSQTRIWRRINHAAQEAICRGFKDAFIWAGTQIRRDAWRPPGGGPVGYLLWWRDFTAEEEQGNVVYDYSGWYNDGSLDGAEFITLPAKGKVLSFSEADDRVWVTVCGTQYALSTFTLEAWIYISSAYTGSILYRPSCVHLSLISGYPAVAFYNGSSWVTLSSLVPATIGAWTHVAAVYNGTQLVLYLDGKLTASTTATGSTPDVLADFMVGTSPSGQFYGYVAEVLVKSIASNQDTVRDDMKRWLWRHAMQVIELVELHQRTWEAPLTFATYKEPIEVTSYDYGGDTVTYTYTPIGYERAGIQRQMIGVATSCQVSIAVSKTLQELIRDNDIRGATMTIKLTFEDADHSNPMNTITIYLGKVVSWALANNVLTIQARELTMHLGGQVPPAQYDYFCRHYFKRNRCLYSGTETECAKTLTACQAYNNVIRFGGFRYVPWLMRGKV